MEKTIVIQSLTGLFEITINNNDDTKDLKYKIAQYNPAYDIHFQKLFRFETEKELTDEDTLNDGDLIALVMSIDIDVQISETQKNGETMFSITWKPSEKNQKIEFTYTYLTISPNRSYFYYFDKEDIVNIVKYEYDQFSNMLEDIINKECNWQDLYKKILIEKIEDIVSKRIPHPFYL